MLRTWAAFPESVPEICEWIYTSARDVGFPEREAERWVLAVEEVTLNIVKYAYLDGPAGMIEVETLPSTSGMTVHVSDSGRSFDPLAAPDPNLKAALEERAIGGLGIYLARKAVDRILYERRDDKNILTLSKKLPR